jgi:hypothetical protein
VLRGFHVIVAFQWLLQYQELVKGGFHGKIKELPTDDLRKIGDGAKIIKP